MQKETWKKKEKEASAVALLIHERTGISQHIDKIRFHSKIYTFQFYIALPFCCLEMDLVDVLESNDAADDRGEDSENERDEDAWNVLDQGRTNGCTDDEVVGIVVIPAKKHSMKKESSPEGEMRHFSSTLKDVFHKVCKVEGDRQHCSHHRMRVKKVYNTLQMA